MMRMFHVKHPYFLSKIIHIYTIICFYINTKIPYLEQEKMFHVKHFWVELE